MITPVGPYSPIVRAGSLVVTSGQLGLLPSETGPVLVEGGTSAQLRQALANALELLSSEALRIEDVIKATVFLVDMSEFADVNEVWIEFFGNHRPARTAIGVGALPLGASVEIELWAVDPSERST